MNQFQFTNVTIYQCADDMPCQLQKLMIESPGLPKQDAKTKNSMRSKESELDKAKFRQFDQELSWCLNPTQQQSDKLNEIKDQPHKGCEASKGLLELITGLPLPDYRILPSETRARLNFEEEKTVPVNDKIQLYPNPTTNWITVNINTNEKQTYFIFVYDIAGKIILNETANKNTFDLDLSKCATGLYSIQIRSENEIIHIGKIVKE